MASPTIASLIAHLRDCHMRAADLKYSPSSPPDAHACCVGVLRQLVAVSRDDKDDATARFRAALLADDALDVAENPESGQSLLELLLLVANSNREAEQSAALLETSVRALMFLPTLGVSPRKHDRLVQLALDLAMTALEVVSISCLSDELRVLTMKSVSDLLRRLEEDADSLLMGVKVLDKLLRSQSGSKAAFPQVSEDVVTTLVRLLLRTPSQRHKLIQSSCDLLLLLADQPELIQAMVSRQLIRALALILQRFREAVDGVVLAAVRLLLRVTRDAHVHGQVINERLMSDLFAVIRHHVDAPQVTAAACGVLAAVMEFANDCRLDLSPFLDAKHCTGPVLIDAAASRVDDVELTSSVVQCLVSASSNPVDLPQLINSASIEGLLALFMSATCGEARTILVDGLRCIIELMPRATVDAFEIKDEATTLPALFLCLQSFRGDLPFAAQVFAIVTRHWKAKGQEVQSIAGYVDISVDRIRLALSRESPTWMTETVECCNFLREILLAENGSCVVDNCGGTELLALLHAKLSAPTAENVAVPVDEEHEAIVTAPSAARLVAAFVGLLEGLQPAARTHASAAASSEQATLKAPATAGAAIPRRPRLATNDRPGDSDYADYVAGALQSESGMYKPRRSVSRSPLDVSSEHDTLLLSTDVQSALEPDTHTANRISDGEEDERPASSESGGSNEVEEAGEDASDVSDADDDDDDDGDSSLVKLSVEEEAALVDPGGDAGLYELGDDDGDGTTVAVSATSTATANATPASTYPSSHQHRHQLPDTLMPGSLVAFDVDPSQLEDRQCYYISTDGIRFPKHPTRARRGKLAGCSASSTVREEEDLVWCGPEYEEPCFSPDPEEAARFVAEATARRAHFDAADAASRARAVYKCASLHELLHRRAQNASVHRQDPSVAAPDSTNDAQGGDNADGDEAECPYHVPDDSRVFADLPHDSLTFDSMFESGNLARAIRVGESEYDLVLRRDLRTNGHMQWFYFAVSNAQPTLSITSSSAAPGAAHDSRRQYRFNIINLCKPDSLFNHGLQPVVYSVRDAREKSVGWRRGGCDVHYFANQYLRTRVNSGSSTTSSASTNSGAAGGGGACYYTLTFTLEFPRQDDTYLIAHSFPYTLQTHRLHMNSLLPCVQHHDRLGSMDNRSQQTVERPLQVASRPILRRSELCKTLGGTSCELLTISNFADVAGNSRELESRRAIVITARVHPGEPQASWMMRGVIDFLVGDSDVARALRRMFVFHLIPMLNPDGVYYGNNRCGLSACDLNRQWLNPSAETHPTIFHAKQLIAREHASRGVVFYCDLHGHSRKQNVFMYGCDTKKRPNPRARAFARELATRTGSFLSLPDCSFKVSKDKEATARVVLAYSLEIPWSFTLEASFCGTNMYTPSEEGCSRVGVHFTTQHFREVGTALCEAIFVNCVTDGSVRERLCAMIDDRSSDFPRIVESFVREAALAVPGSGGKSKTTSKSTSNDSKLAGRSKSKRKSGSLRSVNTDKASSQHNGAGNVNRSSRTPSQPPQPSPRPVMPLRKSSSIVVPETVIPVVGSGIDTSTSHIAAPFDLISTTSPRARLSGKKIRIKKAKSAFGRPGHDPHTTLGRSPTEADRLNAPHLWATEESRIPIKLAASSRQSVTQIGPLWPTLAGSASNGASSEPGGFAAVRTATSAGGVPLPDLGFQPVREAPYVTLPASVSPIAGADPTAAASSIAARSPKPPASRLRFRGAGRQYAAVSSSYQPQQHRSAVLDLLRADTTVTYTYDQNLLNASTMSLRERSLTSVASSASNSVSSGIGNTSPGASNCRLNPLNLEKSATPPRTTATAARTWTSFS